MGAIRRMDHFTLVTDRLAETVAFYAALGLSEGVRPGFGGLEGAWLYAEGRPVLHVIAVERMPEPRRGALDHMAFFAEGLAETSVWLAEQGLRTNLIRTEPPFEQWQLFFKDPNGVQVELDFPADEPPPG